MGNAKTDRAPPAIFWLRRDLRLRDNHGLTLALRSGSPVLPLFIFDSTILEELDNPRDPRLTFLHREVSDLKRELERHCGTSLLVRHGEPGAVFRRLLTDFTVAAVYWNRDYEPAAVRRDSEVERICREHDVACHSVKDHVLLEYHEVLKADGTPYRVFTPYSRRFRSLLTKDCFHDYGDTRRAAGWYSVKPKRMPSLKSLGFQAADITFPERTIDLDRIRRYHETRDRPAWAGTTRLGMHLRFGTISIRRLADVARSENETFFNELIWREFYQAILRHFPQTMEQAFKPAYDRIRWENPSAHFQAWCEGRTGFPLVDAGMRELNATGFMHNRVRMLTASFLSKHLLIDWRRGERYFAARLLDYDAAANVGGWQWAAGCGADAAPYFRVFSPQRQQERFDPDFSYIRRWVPEYGSPEYPAPLVDHRAARQRAIARYRQAVAKGSD